MTTTQWALVIAAAITFFWMIGAYNRLVRLKNAIVNAFAQIDVQLKRRYDLIPNLVEAARAYLQHERATLEAVTEARNNARNANDAVRSRPANAAAVAALGAAEQVLDSTLGRFFALAEAYPDLKADERIRDLSEELTSTENKVAFARQAYNDAALDYNNACDQFPTLLIARIFSFAPSGMLKSTQSVAEREAVAVKL
jgi:LemA protein